MISWKKEKVSICRVILVRRSLLTDTQMENVPHNYINILIKHKGLSEEDASAIILEMVAAEHKQLSNCLGEFATEKLTDHHDIYVKGILRVPLANLHWR